MNEKKILSILSFIDKELNALLGHKEKLMKL